MAAASLIGIVCGMLLGLRFKALVLVPAIMIAGMAAMAADVAGRLPGLQALSLLLAWSLGLEFGYGATLATGLFRRRSPARSVGKPLRPNP